ncbi:eukaryotic translation initiation factor 3 subunit A-like protein [Tanacetum coccineum]
MQSPSQDPSPGNTKNKTKKVKFARSQVQALEEALDVDDLEGDNRPKDLMLSYVSGEKGKERSDRERDTTHRAFQFCKQYKRTTEFRHLCEIIRIHLANLNKYRDKRDRPDLSALESQHFFLDTRSEQTKLKLWQDSYNHSRPAYVSTIPDALRAASVASATPILWFFKCKGIIYPSLVMAQAATKNGAKEVLIGKEMVLLMVFLRGS